MLASQSLGRADAVEHRHVQVEQDRVGLVLGDGGERLLAVGDGGDDLEIGDHIEHHLQPLADDRLVVGDHDPQAFGVCRDPLRSSRHPGLHDPAVADRAGVELAVDQPQPFVHAGETVAAGGVGMLGHRARPGAAFSTRSSTPVSV